MEYSVNADQQQELQMGGMQHSVQQGGEIVLVVQQLQPLKIATEVAELIVVIEPSCRAVIA